MNKKIIGWVVIMLFSLAPAFLLFYLGPKTDIFSYSELTHKLGQLTALIGMTMFALTFVLSTRIKFIENIFGGLDKVYIAHGILGGTALILILFHPVLLVLKFVPTNVYLAATYLLPSSYWSVNFGIIALLGLISLIYITLYTKIKYNHWKFSHKFLGLVFIVAIFHIFLVREQAARDYIFNGYFIYATIVSLIGLISFFYSLFIRNKIFQNAVYKVEKIEKEKGLNILALVPESKPLEYKSGQFVLLRFYNENLTKESHPFSIASKSNDLKLKIIIKNLGDFTSKIHTLQVGDKVSVEGPYGRFNFRENNCDKVWLAGGVGITPFIGMAEDIKSKNSNCKIHLYYSARNDADFIPINDLKEIEKTNKNFHVIRWNTSKKGHLTVEEIEKTAGNLKSKNFYICGPASFKNSIVKELLEKGVSKNKIFEEDFNFR